MLSVIVAAALTLPVMVGGAQEVQSMVAANNQFAVDLYRQLNHTDDNLFFSPYCISKTLAMVYAGARGATEQEMATVLHFTLGQGRQHQAFLETRNLLNSGNGTSALVNPFRHNSGSLLYLASSLWGQHGSGFQQSYLKLIQDYYGGGLREVNFAASEQARYQINAWVAEQTHHTIQELFAPGSLNASTRLVLASAIYFRGDWIHAFPKTGTRKATFWQGAGSGSEVLMMNQTDIFGYFENEQLQGLQMPYQGKDLALIALLPRNRAGLADLERQLTGANLAAWCGQMSEQKVDVSLPRFKLVESIALEDTLSALGMKTAFDRYEADFSGMNGGRERLFISKVIHKAFVDVNEEGTEAAAATGVAMHSLSAAPSSLPVVPVFRADHPFVFAIQNVRTGTLLFLGRVVKP